MFIAIIFLTIIIIVAGVIIDRKSYGDGEVFFLIGIPACIVSLIASLILGVLISSSWVVDEKINMYEVENKKIDSQICTIVENYKGYEGVSSVLLFLQRELVSGWKPAQVTEVHEFPTGASWLNLQ